jgi:hypothetical protein
MMGKRREKEEERERGLGVLKLGYGGTHAMECYVSGWLYKVSSVKFKMGGGRVPLINRHDC